MFGEGVVLGGNSVLYGDAGNAVIEAGRASMHQTRNGLGLITFQECHKETYMTTVAVIKRRQVPDSSTPQRNKLFL